MSNESDKTLIPISWDTSSDVLSESGIPERRAFMQQAAVAVAGLGVSTVAHPNDPESWKKAGSGFSNYGQAATEHNKIIRWISSNPAVPGEGVSWTPLHDLEGIITPNGLHFERHHNGVPDIDADTWSMSIHGKVKRSLSFDLNALYRYPFESRISFIECGGNSNSLWYPTPVQAAAGHLHGLVSCAEWTGVRLSLLLEEAGIDPDAHWLVADGLDASGVVVSLPLEKCLDDVIVALYQNGEPLRRENGYPARLLVPGWEGIVNLKWLRSLQLTDKPLLSKFDTVSYTDLHKNGIAERMTFTMGVKSVITSPSPGRDLSTPGFYEIRGLAWSGAGQIAGVEISADGGSSWTDAILQEPVLDRSLTRFRAPWHWDGSSRVLMSRARDSVGRVQPTRQSLIDSKGTNVYHHYNAILAWGVSATGGITHVYA